MKEITLNDNALLNNKIKEIANIQKPDSNDENLNNYDDEEEYNLDIINKNMEINMENENNYNDFDDNLNVEQNEENIYKDDNNNEYLFENIKEKLKEEKLENQNNNDVKVEQNLELDEDEKYSDIYDLPLSINVIKNQMNSNNKEEEISNKNKKDLEVNQSNENIKNIEKNENNNDKNINNIEKKENKLSIENISDENKKKMIEEKNDTNENININNLEDIDNKNKNISNISPIVNSQKTININNDITDSLDIPKGVKFGVDETGNPINIAQFLEDKNKLNTRNKIIAFIIQKEDKSNYLKDIKGNNLQKTEDDYYLYKDGNEFVIIKDFDVQHPELRVYGHRKINLNEIKSEHKNEDKININKDIKEQINKKKENENKSAKSLIIKENENISKDNTEKDYHNISVKLNIDNFKDKNNYLFKNEDLSEITINSNKKNRSVIIKEKKIKGLKKINNSFYNIKATRNNNFDEQMNIWRQRYGKNSIFDEKSNNFRNDSYNLNSEEKIINRTDSILKMNINKKKDTYKIPINKNNNYITDNKILERKNYLFKEYKNYIIKRQNNSFSKNLDNPILNDSNRKNENDFSSINLERKNKNNLHKFQRNKTLQNINIKYNINKEFNSFNKRNIDYSNKREDLLQNIKQKYKNKLKPSQSDYNMIKNSSIYTNKKKINFENEDIKKHTINNYIYNNLRKINESKYIKKNLKIKCSVLSIEASKIIRDFNIKQKERQKQINIENTNYSNYIQREINKNINTRKNNYYTYVNQDRDKNSYFDYENEKEMPNYNYDDFKMKFIPNKKIKKNKFEMFNNYNTNREKFIKESNINSFYRKIKHNTSNHNNYNYFNF